MNILIVDDSIGILELLKDALEDDGHSVLTAIDGQDGFDKFVQNEKIIDVVVTDLNMPKLNGYKLARTIRFLNQKVPIVLHTSEPNPEKTPDINRVIDKLKYDKLKSYLSELEWPMDRSCDI